MLSILFLTTFGLTTTATLPTGKISYGFIRDLSSDWADFSALISWDQVQAITAAYLAGDKEVQALAEYLDSDDFKNVILAVEDIPEYVAFVDFLETTAGLDFYPVINAIRRYLGFEELPVPANLLSVHDLRSFRITGGVHGLFADIKAVLPADELRALHVEKRETSEAFATLMAQIGSDEFQVITNELKGNEEWQKYRAEVVANGLDIDALFGLLRLFFGLDSTYSKSRVPSLVDANLGNW